MGSVLMMLILLDKVVMSMQVKSETSKRAERRERRQQAMSSKQKPQGVDRYFEEIVKEYQSYLCGVASPVVRRREDIEEVVQIALVKAYINLLGFTEEERKTLKVKEWLSRIVRNESYDYVKRDREILSLEQCEENGSLQLGSSRYDRPDSIIIRIEVYQDVDGMLRRLPERMMKLLLCRYQLGLSYEQISLRLCYDSNGLRVDRTRAIARLRELAKSLGFCREDLRFWEQEYEVYSGMDNHAFDRFMETVGSESDGAFSG
jgi:RNA polymerase sigma-70 factor (ECF subfamily)